MSMILDGSNGVQFNDSSLQGAAASPYGLKNRIINGDMRIDQRAAGASSTAGNGTYTTCDRWATFSVASSKYTVQQNAGSVTPPTGFTNYLGATSSAATSLGATDYYLISQRIEGFNVSDLAWGTANAKTVTLSFWARSSLTGTFGGSINSNSYTRAYPFTYTISSANTWTQISVTIPGDTTGTWLTSNNIGLIVLFNLGCGSTVSGTAGAWNGTGDIYSATGATSVVGTNGATFYLTGVQLEVGSTATPFERRMYGQELALCQRYYEKGFSIDAVPSSANAAYWNGGGLGVVAFATNSLRSISINYRVEKRATPTVTLYNPSGLGTSGNWVYYNGSWATFTTGSIETSFSGTNTFNVRSAATGTTGQTYIVDGGWTASAEL